MTVPHEIADQPLVIRDMLGALAIRDARRLDDGWCAALDRNTMMCTIYEKRPLICREFEMGEVECLNERQGIATAYR